MQEVSHSGKKQFDFDEFLLILARKDNYQYVATKVIEAFKLLYESNDNVISYKALQEILISLGDSMKEEEISKLLKDIEFSEEGQFDYIKFVNNVIQQLQ